MKLPEKKNYKIIMSFETETVALFVSQPLCLCSLQETDESPLINIVIIMSDIALMSRMLILNSF